MTKISLSKLGISELNPMQKAAQKAITESAEVVLLSPTGTGKTLGFLLPIMEQIDTDLDEVQVLILAPSRELAIQIEQVAKDLGSGHKINAVYGGRNVSKDKVELQHAPAILIGTPGRVADHLRRGTVSTDHIQTLVLDEYDKSLEVGFADQMEEIITLLPTLSKKVLTSATQKVDVPRFVGLQRPVVVNHLSAATSQLQIKIVISEEKDKLKALVKLLRHLGDKSGIIFCNYKDTIRFVSDYLVEQRIDHGSFYGGLEQRDRERALIQFRNGTHRVLLATDLAARGLDVPEMDYIIHYQLPVHEEEFIHRNGRTARMHSEGTAYVLQYKDEELRPFITGEEETDLSPSSDSMAKRWTTLFISGGRGDKISKGDIAGLFFKQGKLEKDELGIIELKQDCAFVAVPPKKANKLIQSLNNTRLKKKKVRITTLK